MALAQATRLGHYEIISFIGAGGMGEVYKARDLRLQRDVALKYCRLRSGTTRSVNFDSGVKRRLLPP